MKRSMAALAVLVPLAGGIARTQEPARAVILPDAAGVFTRSSGGTWRPVETHIVRPELRGGLRWISSTGGEYAQMRLDRPRAVLQLSDSRPAFYLSRLTPYSRAAIVRLRSRRYEREVETKDLGGRDWGLRFAAADTIDCDITSSGDIFVVRPRANLPPGEYLLLASAVPGAKWVLLGAEFGISP